MSIKRHLAIAALVLFGWCALVATQYIKHRLWSYGIATELDMEYRVFHIVDDTLDPPVAVPGDERLLVVGECDEDFLLCSIVRNPRYTDWRGQWKVDYCVRPDLEPVDGRVAIWASMKHFPTRDDVDRFKRRALQQRWVIWDCPEGTDHEYGGAPMIAPP